MQQYHDLCKKVLSEGSFKEDRTGTGTKSIFGYQMRFDLSERFSVGYHKKITFKIYCLRITLVFKRRYKYQIFNR